MDTIFGLLKFSPEIVPASEFRGRRVAVRCACGESRVSLRVTKTEAQPDVLKTLFLKLIEYLFTGVIIN